MLLVRKRLDKSHVAYVSLWMPFTPLLDERFRVVIAIGRAYHLISQTVSVLCARSIAPGLPCEYGIWPVCHWSRLANFSASLHRLSSS